MARPRVYDVSLSAPDRIYLRTLIEKGRQSARRIRRAHTLLLADEGYSNETIAEMLHVSANTVINTNRRYVTQGLEASLSEAPRPGAQRKLDGRHEAHLVALACGPAPEGYVKWSLRLLTDQYVTLHFGEALSHETIRQTLKKTLSNRG